MNIRRKLLAALIAGHGAGALTLPIAVQAQPAPKLRRIAYLEYGSRQSMIDAGRMTALMQGLAGFGYVEGRNFTLEARFAEGKVERADALAAPATMSVRRFIRSPALPATAAPAAPSAPMPWRFSC